MNNTTTAHYCVECVSPTSLAISLQLKFWVLTSITEIICQLPYMVLTTFDVCN
jgi:hypothetical protein